MRKEEVLEFFGGPHAAGKAIGITGQAVSMWGDDVPKSRVKAVEMAMAIERDRRERERRREARLQAKQNREVDSPCTMTPS